jgi:hypothetical protein
MARLHMPLSTLHTRPHERPYMTRGRCDWLGVRIQRIVDTRCIQRIVDISARCIQRIVDIGHTHLNLGGELCPVPLDRITKTPNFAEPP